MIVLYAEACKIIMLLWEDEKKERKKQKKERPTKNLKKIIQSMKMTQFY